VLSIDCVEVEGSVVDVDDDDDDMVEDGLIVIEFESVGVDDVDNVGSIFVELDCDSIMVDFVAIVDTQGLITTTKEKQMNRIYLIQQQVLEN
jgi:hypothetical protein